MFIEHKLKREHANFYIKVLLSLFGYQSVISYEFKITLGTVSLVAYIEVMYSTCYIAECKKGAK